MNMKKVWKKVEKVNWTNNYFEWHEVGRGFDNDGSISHIFINYTKPISKNTFDEDINRVVHSTVCTINLDIDFYEHDDDTQLEISYELSVKRLGGGFEQYINSFNAVEPKDLIKTLKQDIDNIVTWLDAYDAMLTDGNFKETDEERIIEFANRLSDKLEKDDE